MSRKQFYRLTWWEWGLWTLRIHKLRQDRLEDHEVTMEMTRQVMAMYVNSQRDRNSPPVMPQEFWKLSYDKEDTPEPEEKPKSFQEVKAKLGSKFKRDVK